jgi:hypothetical protein
MSTHNPSRIDLRTAEHLLSAAPMGKRDGHPPLAALLAAAAVPGRPDELTSEQATVVAFRTAPLDPVSRTRRLSAVKTAVMKILTVKAVAVLAATTASGMALAASTGTLPNPLAQPARVTSSGLSAASPTPEQPRGEPSDGGGPANSAGPESSKSPKSRGASSVPLPALVGLCRAYGASNKAKHGTALDNPAFRSLIALAGGKDRVDLFCKAVLAAPTSTDGQPHDGPDRDEDHRTRGQYGRSRGEDGPTTTKSSPTYRR